MQPNVNWFEVAGDDVDGLRGFYTELFGWETADVGGTGYHQVTPQDGGVPGGIWSGGAPGRTWAIFYVQVDGLDKAVARAEELGATVAMPVSGNGPVRFAHIQDPAGNRFGLYEPVE